MEKLKIGIDQELAVMIALEITAEEWFFIQLLFLYKEGHQDYLYRYFTEAKKDIVPKALLESLKSKNIIENKYKIPEQGENFDPGQIPLSKDFTKKYLKSSLELGAELLDIFPPFIVGRNGNFPIKNFSKFYRSMEDFCFAYSKAIKFNPVKHKEIMELLEWAIENGLITFNIAEFVIGQHWIDLAKMKDEGCPINIKFDSTELL